MYYLLFSRKASGNNLLLIAGLIFAVILTACSESPTADKTDKSAPQSEVTTSSEEEETVAKKDLKSKAADFIPEGYVLFEKIEGDLNKDGLKDCVLLVKGTDKKRIVEDEERGALDQNRRGVIVLLKWKEGYEQLTQNIDCFSSENEDGGVYYAPELSLEIKKNNLYVRYEHGRYGYWSYTFRMKDQDMELIGYDNSENHGAMVMTETSINFLTKKKLVKENVNEEAENSGDEQFVENSSKVKIDKLMKLSEIKDFDGLDMSKW